MVDERAHLAQLDRHIAEAKEHMRKQQQLIQRLNVSEHLDEAKHFLFVLTGTLEALQQQRSLILDRL